MQTAGKWKLRRQSVLGRNHPRLQLARMSLHLVAVLVDTAEEVCAAVHVQHDAVALCDVKLLAGVVVLAHLDPLGVQDCAVSPPLPPFLPANGLDALGTQLRVDELSRARQLSVG
jgi:hypothetical protein